MKEEKELSIPGVFTCMSGFRFENFPFSAVVRYSIHRKFGNMRIYLSNGNVFDRIMLCDKGKIKRFLREYSDYKKNISLGNIKP
jgi:hypothetical protein